MNTFDHPPPVVSAFPFAPPALREPPTAYLPSKTRAPSSSGTTGSFPDRQEPFKTPSSVSSHASAPRQFTALTMTTEAVTQSGHSEVPQAVNKKSAREIQEQQDKIRRSSIFPCCFEGSLFASRWKTSGCVSAGFVGGSAGLIAYGVFSLSQKKYVDSSVCLSVGAMVALIGVLFATKAVNGWRVERLENERDQALIAEREERASNHGSLP
jgi:hypothetical protein